MGEYVCVLLVTLLVTCVCVSMYIRQSSWTFTTKHSFIAMVLPMFGGRLISKFYSSLKTSLEELWKPQSQFDQRPKMKVSIAGNESFVSQKQLSEHNLRLKFTQLILPQCLYIWPWQTQFYSQYINAIDQLQGLLKAQGMRSWCVHSRDPHGGSKSGESRTVEVTPGAGVLAYLLLYIWDSISNIANYCCSIWRVRIQIRYTLLVSNQMLGRDE